METLRFGAIDYINSLPFFAPFLLGKNSLSAKLIFDVPSILNQKLLNGTLDLSFISSSVFLQNKERFSLVPDFCIAASNRVESVLLFTKVPVDALSGKEIGLTKESASSITLLKILCKKYWQISPNFVLANSASIQKYPAYLTIGDDALVTKPPKDYHSIDLAEAWHEFTGLPFVFAVLAIKKGLLTEAKTISTELNEALKWSKTHMEEVYKLATTKSSLQEKQLRHYYSLLEYQMNPTHEKALTRLAALQKDPICL